MNKFLTLAGLLYTSLVIFNCSNNKVAGSETGNTDPGISGYVIDTLNNIPGSNIQVSLIPVDFLNHPLKDSVSNSSQIKVTHTDENGYYHFDDVDSGNYNIHLNAENNYGAILNYKLEEVGQANLMDTAILLPTQNIIGTLDIIPQDQKYFAHVLGLDRYAQADSQSGKFILMDIPIGVYTIIISDEILDTTIIVDTITLTSDSAFYFDNIIPIPWDTIHVPIDTISNPNDTTNHQEDSIKVTPYLGWSNQMLLKINSQDLNLGGPVNNYPMLIQLDSLNFNFNQADSSGKDIRFSNSSDSSLPYEIENWDPISKKASIWVLIDSISSQDTTKINLHWGKADALSESNGSAVFESNQGNHLVWHLEEKVLDSGSFISDASGNSNTGITRQNPPPTSSPSGISSHGIDFNGTQYIDSRVEEFNPNTFTLSFWFKSKDTSGGKFIGFTNHNSLIGDTNLTGHDRQIWMDDKGILHFGVFDDSLPLENRIWALEYEKIISSSKTYNDNQWHYVVGSFKAYSMALYIDGEKIGSIDTVAIASNHNGIWRIAGGTLNQWINIPANHNFSGTMDEVRILYRIPSEGWIRLNYESQKQNSNFIIFE